MPSNLEVFRAEVGLEATYSHPEFDLFESSAGLLGKLYKRLEKHGLKLAEIRAENSSIIGDRHLIFHLFNYVMTSKIRYDKIEVNFFQFPRTEIEKYSAALLDTLAAMKDAVPKVSYKTFATAVALHGRIEGQPTKTFLNRLTSKSPEGLGPSTG